MQLAAACSARAPSTTGKISHSAIAMALADREQRGASDEPRRAHDIDERAGRHLPGQGDEPAGGEHQPDVDLGQECAVR